jgi:hypothetical protein
MCTEHFVGHATFTSPSSSASRIPAPAPRQVLFGELALPAQVLEYALELSVRFSNIDRFAASASLSFIL